MSKWVQGTVTGNVRWTERLYSLQVEAPEVTFVAGQFGRLALPAPPGSKEEMLGRPYSFVNAPGSAPHEFYFVIVEGGPLSPRLAALAPGESVSLLRNANGFFCVDEVPCRTDGHCSRPGWLPTAPGRSCPPRGAIKPWTSGRWTSSAARSPATHCAKTSSSAHMSSASYRMGGRSRLCVPTVLARWAIPRSGQTWSHSDRMVGRPQRSAASRAWPG